MGPLRDQGQSRSLGVVRPLTGARGMLGTELLLACGQIGKGAAFWR